MAATYTIVTQYPTVEYLGGTQTQQVVAVGASTIPHGIYFEVRIPQSIYATDIVKATVEGTVPIYETLAGFANVTGVAWSQVPTAAGELADQVTITVSSTSGNSAGQLTYLVLDLGSGLHETEIEALHNELDATEAL